MALIPGRLIGRLQPGKRAEELSAEAALSQATAQKVRSQLDDLVRAVKQGKDIKVAVDSPKPKRRIVNRVPVLKPRTTTVTSTTITVSAASQPVGGTIVIGGRVMPYDAPASDLLAAAKGL